MVSDANFCEPEKKTAAEAVDAPPFTVTVSKPSLPSKMTLSTPNSLIVGLPTVTVDVLNANYKGDTNECHSLST